MPHAVIVLYFTHPINETFCLLFQCNLQCTLLYFNFLYPEFSCLLVFNLFVQYQWYQIHAANFPKFLNSCIQTENFWNRAIQFLSYSRILDSVITGPTTVNFIVYTAVLSSYVARYQLYYGGNTKKQESVAELLLPVVLQLNL